jgi:CDGSH-type Zn-finger protein
MNEPRVPGHSPLFVKLERGKSYAWCACGRSATQPFCDGAHAGTGSEPLRYRHEGATNEFARSYISDEAEVPEIADDQADVVGHVSSVVRSWRNVERVADLGGTVGGEVVRLLQERPELVPQDVVYLCEYHHDGLAAARVIEAAGYPVHHVYSRDPDERHRSKSRFWPEAEAVKGCTVHSYKGWDSPAVVVGIGMEERSRRLGYASMTRVSSTAPDTDTAYLVVVNADPRLADFQPVFEVEAALAVDA